ncbi:unnamed protein product [Prunus brigantina]
MGKCDPLIENLCLWDNLEIFIAKKNTRGPCRQLKTAKITRVTNSRINIGYDERHRAAPTANQRSSLAHNIGHVNYNLEDLDDESLAYVNRLFAERYKQWKSNLHHHFQAFDDLQKKAKANKGNRDKKTLLHHSGSRPFSYRMEARWRRGSKFPEIDIFGNVYVRPGNELAESLRVTTMMEKS